MARPLSGPVISLTGLRRDGGSRRAFAVTFAAAVAALGGPRATWVQEEARASGRWAARQVGPD